MKRLAVLAALALASCASPGAEGPAVHGAMGLESTADRIPLSDGSQAWLISCPGALNNLSTCVARAKRACPEGYRLAPPGSGPQMGGRALLVVCGAARP